MADLLWTRTSKPPTRASGLAVVTANSAAGNAQFVLTDSSVWKASTAVKSANTYSHPSSKPWMKSRARALNVTRNLLHLKNQEWSAVSFWMDSSSSKCFPCVTTVQKSRTSSTRVTCLNPLSTTTWPWTEKVTSSRSSSTKQVLSIRSPTSPRITSR